MDSSTPPLQNMPGDQPTVGDDQQTLMQAQSLSQLAADKPVSSALAQPVSSGSPEQGPIQTSAGQAESQDDIVQPAKQEVAAAPVQSTGEAEKIELKHSTPEISVEKSVEHVVEKSPDTDKPTIPDAVKAVGVTHSGPGVVVDENAFNIHAMPMTYEEAVVQEKQHPKLNDSKHWMAELVEYVWRKIDPQYGKTKGVKK